MKLLHDFTSPVFWGAIDASVRNGFMIVTLMFCLGAILVILGGGLTASKNIKPVSSNH